MSQINPFIHAVIQSVQGQRVLVTEKDRQLREKQEQEKNIATHEDVFEHTVESSDELAAIHDEESRKQPKKRPGKQKSEQDQDGEDDTPHLDLTA